MRKLRLMRLVNVGAQGLPDSNYTILMRVKTYLINKTVLQGDQFLKSCEAEEAMDLLKLKFLASS